MKLLVAALSLVAIIGCKDSGGSASCGSKSLFTQWTADDNSTTLDLTSVALNQATPISASTGTQSCTGSLLVTGSECTGTATISGMTWNGDGGSDPGCAGLDGSSTFTKNANGLSICENGTCDHYN